MRTIVFLSALGIAAAISNEEQGTCLVDGAEAVSDALDASMFIWASIARCGHNGEMVKCEIGVSSAITSVNSMINVILKAIDKCGQLNTVNKACGIAASEMTKHIGGLTSSSGGLVQKCFQGPAHGVNWNHADAALCTVNIKNTAKNLFKTVRSFQKLDNNCLAGAIENSNACAANALQIAGGFAAIGEFLAGAIGKCAPTGQYKGAVCAQAAERLTQQLTEFAERAIDTADKCAPPPPPAAPAKEPAAAPVDEAVTETSRLYSREAKANQSGANTNIFLAAFLPVTAIVGFVGGRVYGSRRTTGSTREMPTTPYVE